MIRLARHGLPPVWGHSARVQHPHTWEKSRRKLVTLFLIYTCIYSSCRPGTNLSREQNDKRPDCLETSVFIFLNIHNEGACNTQTPILFPPMPRILTCSKKTNVVGLYMKLLHPAGYIFIYFTMDLFWQRLPNCTSVLIKNCSTQIDVWFVLYTQGQLGCYIFFLVTLWL